MPVSQERHYACALRLLGALAVLARLAFVLVLHPPRNFLYSDMESYDYVALELLSGRTNPWHAFRPVGYSMLLAFVYALTDVSRTFVGVIQAVMGGLLAPWSAQLARAAGAGKGGALLIGTVVACCLPLILYCGLILTEVSSAFFLLFALKLLMVPEAGAPRFAAARLFKAGLCLGLASAVRPNFMLALPVLGLYSWYAFTRPTAHDTAVAPRPRFATLRPWFALATGLALPLALVCAYNSYVLGRPAGPTCNGGINFYLNFAEVHTIHYQGPLGQYWISPVPNGITYTRVEPTHVPLFEDAYYYARGVRYVREHPRVLRDALVNFPEAFGVGRQLMWPDWPGHERLLRGYAHVYFAAVLVPALLTLAWLAYRAFRRRARPEALAVAALCASSALPIYLFLGDPRVRVPFDPLWILLAGLGGEALVRGLVGRFWRRRLP